MMSILGSLLFITAVKAQTTPIKKETVNPGSSQTAATSVSSKDHKSLRTDPKGEAAAKAVKERAIKDAKNAPQIDLKKEVMPKEAAERATKDAKILHKGK